MAWDELDDPEVRKLIAPYTLPGMNSPANLPAVGKIQGPMPQPAQPPMTPAAIPTPRPYEMGGTPVGMQPPQEAKPNTPTFPSRGEQMATEGATEAQRLKDTGPGWSQVQNPFLRGIARVGDIASSVLTPGLSSRIPGTTLHNEALQGQARGEEAQGVKQEGEEAQQAATQAEVPLREAQEEEARAKAEAAANPKAAKEENPEQQAFDAYVKSGMSPSDAFRKVQQDKQEGIALGKPAPEEKNYQQFADEYKQQHPNGTVAETQRAYKLNQELPQRPPVVEVGNYTPVTNQAGATIGWVDPKSGHFKPVSEIPGLGEAAGGNSIAPKPTVQERNADVQANLSHAKMPEIMAEIDSLGKSEELGPIMGRWNDFMQGKVGAKDPAFATLRTDLLFLTSAIALMHAQGRLPENLREEFDHAINAPKQDPENLKAILKTADKWLTGRIGVLHPEQGGNQPETAAPPKPGDVVDGFRFKGGAPGNKSNWEKVQ